MRKKLLLLNTITSLLLQIVTLICGFILPKFTMSYFGSDVNGLVNSLNQFLSVIAFMELGVGAVVQSALYKPLAFKDNEEINSIVSSASRFFKKIAILLLFYIGILLIVYPLFVNKAFSPLFVDSLLLIMCIGSFVQYYFGIVDKIVLNSDQHGYVHYLVQICCVLLNTIICVVLIRLKKTIHIVKLATSIIYLIQPICIRYFLKKKYNLSYNVKNVIEPIKQKWNGVAQHISAIILDSTDMIILTVFSSLANVSIYSVYNMIVNGLRTLLMFVSNSTQALIGELWAKKEIDNLKNFVTFYEWAINVVVVFIFGVTSVLIVEFVSIYTLNIVDADYYQPLFSSILTLASAAYCLRFPYLCTVLAAGHYKETQNSFVISAVLNVFISIFAVKSYGLIGVAIGTLISMSYQTIWLAFYVSKKLKVTKFATFIKNIAVDLVIVVFSTLICKAFINIGTTYVSWIINAFIASIIWALILLIVNALLNRKMLSTATKKIVRTTQNS
ncbi:MAG: polysaccharide biosynthesis C-terminal domain-containing protein [Erysipelotrichaceae bacterium]|nr:polysaccharide biosynthesis C-terminal domain-containing protein [Erysipelotrichaceae bacterium]